MRSWATARTCHLNGVLSGLDLAEVLPDDWVKKFKGMVNGDFNWSRRLARTAGW